MAQTKKRAPQVAKPFYLVASVNDEGKIVNHVFTRKTDEVIEAMQAHSGCEVIKLDPPKAPPRAPKAS